MRRFDKKKIIREANLRLEQEFIYEKMLMTEIGEAAPYTIRYDDNGSRIVVYEINTTEYGIVTMELTIAKYFKEDFDMHSYKFKRVGIEYVEDKDYALGVSFNVRKTEKGYVSTYGTMNAQPAKIMATNVAIISDYINEMAAKDYHLVMIFSSPVSDGNDKTRDRAIGAIKSYVENRPVTEREVRGFVKIKNELSKYHDDIFQSVLINGDFYPQMTDDEREEFENNIHTFMSNLDLAKNIKSIILCLYDKQYSLDNLLRQAKQEAAATFKEGDSELVTNSKTYIWLLRKIRNKINSMDWDDIKLLVSSAKISSTALPAEEGSMRERLYNRYFDEQIASNPLVKNFVKFSKGGEMGIYDELKAKGEEVEEKGVEAPAGVDDAITAALNSKKLIIKIGKQSSINDLSSENSMLSRAYTRLLSNNPHLSNLINVIANTLVIKDIERDEAEKIVRELRVGFNGNLNHGQDHIEITYGGQPFDVPNN